MGQRYKTVYFADHPAESPQQRNLTLAVGGKDSDLYDYIRPLSSHELRELLGHASFASLQRAADQDGLAINTYCLRILRHQQRALQTNARQITLFNDSVVTPDLYIEPIQATFKGGQQEPLHAWYPYLEGYSPGFVEQILMHFAPQATRILDPFSGSGTTPLTVARLGRRAYYCELNPLLQYLTDAKMLALRMDDAERIQVTGRLHWLAEHLEDVVRGAAQDAHLHASYLATFGDSQFFDPQTFDAVLRLRTAIDQLACSEPLPARFLTIATLASLIPASRLIRRGDVRYRNERELQREQAELLSVIRSQLELIAADIERLRSIAERAVLVAEDAHQLDKLPNLSVDAVITSPPYLNGTNYFRNTKVELWFLRCLRNTTELAGYRFKAVTAGINDVTVSKLGESADPMIADLISQLEACAYDSRIPRMVASYYADMKTVFGALKHHLADGASVLVDIGDSMYAGVHVPTDTLLTQMLTAQGYRFDRSITLRQRMSRNGSTLHQVLLAFRYNRPRRQWIKEEKAASLWPRWTFRWIEFKETLPHQQGKYAKRNWGNPLHSLCSYQGKMKPSLAAQLVNTFVPENGTLLDPFAGVGTIPFEAALQGKRAWAFDISPATLHITAAKLGRPNAAECHESIRMLMRYLADNHPLEQELGSAYAIHFNGALPDYFHPQTLREILLARRYFLERPPSSPSQSLVFASLLHILHGNRPYALSRRSHPITPFAPSGPVEYRPLIPRLRDKVERGLAVEYPQGFAEGHAVHQDATSWWPQEVDQLDAIITSPPFFDSTRFYLANWMRLWFSGWEAADFKSQPLAFVDERQKQSFDIYEPIFRQARERLKPNGVLVLHLGKSRKCDMAQALSSIATRWFRVADIFSESVEHCESHGIRDKGTVEEHSYLVLC